MNTTTRASDESELRLVALPEIHVVRSQLQDIETVASYLQMDIEHVVRSALVEYIRRPAFDTLFHRRRDYDDDTTLKRRKEKSHD